MDNIVKVYISGPALSLLLYENLRCLFNQEGFLLGKKYARKVSKITDHDEPIETIEWEIHINSVVPCPKLASFYNASGGIMQDSLLSILSELHEDVVGWYTFKRESELKLRLREKIVHKRLSAVFSTDAMEHFVWCANTTINTQEKHTSRQIFLRYIDGVGSTGLPISGFQELPLHIINLSDSKNEYKSAGIPSVSLNALMSSLKAASPSIDNNNLITKIENNLQNKITKAVKDTSISELELFDLEQEITQLMQHGKISETDDSIDSPVDLQIDSNESNEDTEIVEETPKIKGGTKQQRRIRHVLDQSPPINGVSLNRVRGDSSSPSTSTSISVPVPKSYSQVAKVKQ